MNQLYQSSEALLGTRRRRLHGGRAPVCLAADQHPTHNGMRYMTRSALLSARDAHAVGDGQTGLWDGHTSLFWLAAWWCWGVVGRLDEEDRLISCRSDWKNVIVVSHWSDRLYSGTITLRSCQPLQSLF